MGKTGLDFADCILCRILSVSTLKLNTFGKFNVREFFTDEIVSPFKGCCSSAHLCPTICDPMDCSTPSLPVPHHLPEFAQVHVHCFPDGSDGKASTYNVGDLGSIPGSGRSPGGRKWQPTPVFLPGESHGQRSLTGYSLQDHKSQTRLSV